LNADSFGCTIVIIKSVMNEQKEWICVNS